MSGAIIVLPLYALMEWTGTRSVGRSVREPKCCVCVCRRRGLRELPQEQGKESPDDVHRGAAAGVAGQLPAGLEPGRTRSGAHRADHGSQ